MYLLFAFGLRYSFYSIADSLVSWATRIGAKSLGGSLKKEIEQIEEAYGDPTWVRNDEDWRESAEPWMVEHYDKLEETQAKLERVKTMSSPLFLGH